MQRYTLFATLVLFLLLILCFALMQPFSCWWESDAVYVIIPTTWDRTVPTVHPVIDYTITAIWEYEGCWGKADPYNLCLVCVCVCVCVCARASPCGLEHMSGRAKVTGLSRIQTGEYTAADLALIQHCTTTNTCMSAQRHSDIRACLDHKRHTH